MFKKIGRLFVIKNRFEACAVIYAIALGAVERGMHYLDLYPGWGGYLLFMACMVAVFMAGAKIFDAVAPRRKPGMDRRRGADRRSANRSGHKLRRQLADYAKA